MRKSTLHAGSYSQFRVDEQDTAGYGARVVTDEEGLDYGGWGQVQGEQLGVQAE